MWHFPLCRGCYNRKVRAGTTCPADATHTRHPPPPPLLLPSADGRCLILLRLRILEVRDAFRTRLPFVLHQNRPLAFLRWVTSTPGLKGFHAAVSRSDSPRLIGMRGCSLFTSVKLACTASWSQKGSVTFKTAQILHDEVKKKRVFRNS